MKLTIPILFFFLIYPIFLNAEEEYEVEVKGVAIERMSSSPVVILYERKTARFVPIWIGIAEATAIATAKEGIKPPRPMTHDLLNSTIKQLGGKVKKVKVTELKEGTYYAIIVIDVGGKEIQIDSRPSDAIALALRANSPIFISKQIMDVSIKIPKDDIIDEKLKIEVQEITPELSEFFGVSEGVIITNIKKGSPLEGKAERGEVIIEINGKKPKMENLEEEITNQKKIKLKVKGEKIKEITINLK